MWTPPRTWIFDEVPSEAVLNTHIRDQLRALCAATRVNQPATGYPGGIVSFATESYDDLGGWAIANPTYVVIPWAGYYRVYSHTVWTGATGDGGVQNKIERYNSANVLQELICQDDGGLNGVISCAGLTLAALNDRIKLNANMGATGVGGDLNVRLIVQAAGGPI